jgi:hypothetical protein
LVLLKVFPVHSSPDQYLGDPFHMQQQMACTVKLYLDRKERTAQDFACFSGK